MKKFVFLFLAGLLILAFGAIGYAQEAKLDFRASGFIDAQSYYLRNVPPLAPSAMPIFNSLGTYLPGTVGQSNYGAYNVFNPSGTPAKALDHKISYWDSRMHLKFDAVMGKELSGTVQFEIDATRWGSAANNTQSSTSGPGTAYRDANQYGYWSTDRSAVEVKYVYIDVGLPYFGIPAPMTFRAGAQPLAIRPAFFVATDGTGVTGGINLDPITINPLWFKMAQGIDWNYNGSDVYGLQLMANVSTFKMGGYGLWYHMGTYPMYYYTSAGLYSATVPSMWVLAYGTQKADFQWLGFYADGKAGPVNINFDLGYDHGKVQSTAVGTTAPDVKYTGWAGRVKVDYPWEKFNFGVIGMYASGSDANKTSQTGLAGDPTANPTGNLTTKVSGWMVPPGSEAGAVNSESAVFYGMEAGALGGVGYAVNHNYFQASKGPFGGSAFFKLYSSYKVAPWYKATVQGLYIWDTTDHGNTIGTARMADGITLRDDKAIGFELDMINEFQIYKNLVFKVFGGYLWAGRALDQWDPNKNGVGVGGNYSIKNPFAFRTRLLYTF